MLNTELIEWQSSLRVMHTKNGKSNSKHKHNDGAKYAHQNISSNKNGNNTQPGMLPFEFAQLNLMIRSRNKTEECQHNGSETQHHLNRMQNATTFTHSS